MIGLCCCLWGSWPRPSQAIGGSPVPFVLENRGLLAERTRGLPPSLPSSRGSYKARYCLNSTCGHWIAMLGVFARPFRSLISLTNPAFFPCRVSCVSYLVIARPLLNASSPCNCQLDPGFRDCTITAPWPDPTSPTFQWPGVAGSPECLTKSRSSRVRHVPWIPWAAD